MDHLVAAAIAEDRLDPARLVAEDAQAVLAGIGHETAAQATTALVLDRDRVATLELARDLGDAGGQQALALAQRGDGAVVQGQRARSLQAAGDPALARGGR